MDPTPGQAMRLIIELGPTGRVQVHGPIANKLLCYGLLEAARDAIKDYVDKHTSTILVPERTVSIDPNGNGQ